MGKNVRENAGREGPAIRRPSPGNQSILTYLTLAGLAILLFLGFQGWSESRHFRKSLEDRLGGIENRISDLTTKVQAIPAAPAAAPRRGPDPNKVYTVKTKGSPALGPANAPVTIAEFSDFQ